jgi:hypothetical protein
MNQISSSETKDEREEREERELNLEFAQYDGTSVNCKLILPLSTPTAWPKPKSNKKAKNEFLTLGQLWFTLKSIEIEENINQPDPEDIRRNGITYKDESLNPDLIEKYT